MRQTVLYSFCAIIILKLVYVHANQPVQRPAPDNETPLVLQNFGNMLVSFFELLKKPKDQDHALTQVGNMVQGMVNIGQIACRRGTIHCLEEQLMSFFNTNKGQLFLMQWNEALIMQSRSVKTIA